MGTRGRRAIDVNEQLVSKIHRPPVTVKGLAFRRHSGFL